MNPGATLFFAQIVILLVVVLASILNLSLTNANKVFWTSLLCSSIGYVLPNPTWKRKKPEEEDEGIELDSIRH